MSVVRTDFSQWRIDAPPPKRVAAPPAVRTRVVAPRRPTQKDFP